MKILEITSNEYGRNFLTISIEGTESFKGNVHKRGRDYTMYCYDNSGRCHEIKVKQEQACIGFNIYKVPEYYNTYCVGNGNGSNMGWVLGLSKRDAFKIARARMAACQSMELVARVYVR